MSKLCFKWQNLSARTVFCVDFPERTKARVLVYSPVNSVSQCSVGDFVLSWPPTFDHSTSAFQLVDPKAMHPIFNLRNLQVAFFVCQGELVLNSQSEHMARGPYARCWNPRPVPVLSPLANC